MDTQKKAPENQGAALAGLAGGLLFRLVAGQLKAVAPGIARSYLIADMKPLIGGDEPSE